MTRSEWHLLWTREGSANHYISVDFGRRISGAARCCTSRPAVPLWSRGT